VNLQRKIDLLEDELDRAEKNVKETMEKLRQVDVKAEHFERQVHRAEQERDTWEKKYEVRCLCPIMEITHSYFNRTLWQNTKRPKRSSRSSSARWINSNPLFNLTTSRVA
jgi:chromosome segregation ATPase